jgi:hypothetical protein
MQYTREVEVHAKEKELSIKERIFKEYIYKLHVE